MIFSYYTNTSSYTPHQYCMWELQDLITSGTTKQTTEDYRQGKISKEQLPFIIPCAVMQKGKKNAGSVVGHSGLIWLDIDLKNNQDIEQKLQAINNDKYTYYTWHSISGGIRIVVCTTCNNVEDHLTYWQAVVDYYQQTYKIVVDPKPKAVNSFCFFNYDPTPYSNVSSTTFKLTSTPVVKKICKKVSKVPIINKYKIGGVDTFSGTTVYNYKTCISEYLFKDKQQPLYIASGVSSCELFLTPNLTILEGNRNKWLAVVSMILLYNNPSITLKQLCAEVNRLNLRCCSPAMLSKDVYSICNNNYTKHINNTLNFSCVLSTKYVFYSKEFKGVMLTDEQQAQLQRSLVERDSLKKEFNKKNKHKLSMKCLKDGKQQYYEQRIYDTIEALQGQRMTYKIIAEHIGVGEQVIKRRITPELKSMMK